MQPVCAYTDYFVVVTGNNPRQTKGIWDEVHGAHEEGARPATAGADGEREATWIVGDFSRRRAARLHARGAGVLPPRGAVGRRPAGDGRSSHGQKRRADRSFASAVPLLPVLTTDQKASSPRAKIAAAASRLEVGVSKPMGDERYDLDFDLRPDASTGAVQMGVCAEATSSSFLYAMCRRGPRRAHTSPIRTRRDRFYCGDTATSHEQCYLLPPRCRSIAQLCSCGLRPSRNNQIGGCELGSGIRVRGYT